MLKSVKKNTKNEKKKTGKKCMYRIKISTKRHKTEPKEVLEMKRISKMITSVEGFHIRFEQAKTELEILKLNN